MKRILMILALLFVFSEAFSQENYVSFTAKEGLPSALQTATEQGFVNSTLMLVGVTNTIYTIGGQPIDVKFDINTGKSESWIYIIYDSTTDDYYGWALLKKVSGEFVPFSFDPSQLTNYGISLNQNYTLEGVDWFDSDSMATEFRGDTEMYNFYTQKETPDGCSVAIFNNSFLPFLDFGKTYWALSVENNGFVKSCGLDVATDEINCSTQAGVDDNIATQNDISIYPNPASNEIELNALGLTENAEVQIYSAAGNLQLEARYNQENTFNISSLPNGMYYLKVSIGEAYKIIPFSVVK